MSKVFLYGDIGYWPLTADNVVPQIMAGDDALDIHISSGGGYVIDGLAIASAIQSQVASGRTVRCYIDSIAASMASLIAIAAPDVMMAANGLFMIHSPHDGAYGTPEQMRQKADMLDKLRDQAFGTYAARAGITVNELKAQIDAAGGELWLTADEALAAGYVTGVLEPMAAAASVDLSKFGYRKVPDHPLVMMAGATPPATAGKPQENGNMTTPNPAAAAQPPAGAIAPVDATMAASAAVTAERTRVTGIEDLCRKHGIEAELRAQMIADGTTLEQARAKVLDKLAMASDATASSHSPAVVTADARDKWLQGASNAILMRAGVADIVMKAAQARGETIDLNPGEFRGATMAALASEALQRAGETARSRDPMMVVGQAFTAKSSVPGLNNAGDFAILLENTLNKTLLASYALAPRTWNRWCRTGSVTDFRPHPRYRAGSFGALDLLNANGEIRQRSISDGRKETITAATRANIIGLTRQAIANDDLSVFSSLAVDLGRSAGLSVELDAYALLASNPTMSDGNALFSTQHNNIITTGGGAPSIAQIDAMRVLMKNQRDVSGNEVLDLNPVIWLGPTALGSAARVVNTSQFNPDSGGTRGQQSANPLLGMLQAIIDTARITGTGHYLFADPAIAPVIEVAFLNGVQEPFIDMQDGWRFDGTEWKVQLDYAVGAIGWEGAVFNDGD
ncbi:MAG: Clp protease ClpP [Alphaproteobacteria bacterium]|nr:Clp protease ClpP [Alphaproteobacteria bacterium]